MHIKYKKSLKEGETKCDGKFNHKIKIHFFRTDERKQVVQENLIRHS